MVKQKALCEQIWTVLDKNRSDSKDKKYYTHSEIKIMEATDMCGTNNSAI